MRSKKTPLESVSDSYLLSKHDLRERTREEYRTTLKQFTGWLRANEYEGILGDLDRNVVNQYVAERRKTSVYVARAAAANLKAFGTWLAASGILHERNHSVLEDIRTPKVPQDVRRPLGDADVATVLKAAKGGRTGERDYALVLLVLDTGLRLNELNSLTAHDVDFREFVLTVQAETSKGNRTREVRFGRETARALDRYIQDFRVESERLPEGTDRLWLTDDGMPLTLKGMGLIFTRIRNRSGVRGFKAHVCRHTWATNFRRRDSGDLLDLKAQGGWRDDKMLQRYSHALPLRDRRRGPSPVDAMFKDLRGGGVRQSPRESVALRVISGSGEAS